MPITRVEVQNIRRYREAEFEPDARANLIVGDNASGKTTILEALFLVGSGRSFRSASLDAVQTHGSEFLRVAVDQLGDEGRQQLGFARSGSTRRLLVNGVEQGSLSALAQRLPVQVISPDTHFEFQHQARARRAALDWLLFHVEPGFHEVWSRYQRVLAQRNTALKDPRQAKARYAWDPELAGLGDELQARRLAALGLVQSHFQRVCSRLFDDALEASVTLEPGWEAGQGMTACLAGDRGRDLARGFTHSGPHRNDLRLWIGPRTSREQASHGQSKLLVIALRLAQIEVLLERTGRQCCLLVDDLPAELDRNHRMRLTSYLAGIPGQVFLTSTDRGLIDLGAWSTRRTFHVEQGTIRALPSD